MELTSCHPLARRILMWLLDFWKTFSHLPYNVSWVRYRSVALHLWLSGQSLLFYATKAPRDLSVQPAIWRRHIRCQKVLPCPCTGKVVCRIWLFTEHNSALKQLTPLASCARVRQLHTETAKSHSGTKTRCRHCKWLISVTKAYKHARLAGITPGYWIEQWFHLLMAP
jgi:hypothetical protein